MATFRKLMVQDDTGWHLMSPSNPWEALRLAWMLWRYPDRVAALVGVKEAYMVQRCRRCDDKQAAIDRLMLEHCPDEMTPEQIAEWGRHQKPAPNATVKGAA